MQANIFFLITGIAVVIFTLLLCILLYHVIKIVRSVRKIVDRIEEGSEVIAEDLFQLRKYFAENSIISTIIGMFFGRSADSKRRNGSRRKPAKKEAERSLSVSSDDQHNF